MCKTVVISRHIVKIGRKSYDRRLRIASPNYEEKRGELPRLLNEVDKLSNLLHNEFHTITAEDYAAFAQELNIVINTLKSLYQESRQYFGLKVHNDRMLQQIADLEELDHDIRVFRVNAAKNMDLQNTLSVLSKIDLSRFSQK